MSDLALICIVGTSRSGTTMLNHVLGESSSVLAFNELHFLGKEWCFEPSCSWSRADAEVAAARLLATSRRSIWENRPTPQELQEGASIVADIQGDLVCPGDIYERSLLYLMNLAERNLVVDQTPRNIYFAHKILEQFPQAKIIQMIRDPRAVMLSQRNRWRQKWLGADHIPLRNSFRVRLNYHPITMSKLWNDACSIGTALEGHPRFLQVVFEELLKNPEKQVQEICHWLEIEFRPEMLNPPNVGSSSSWHDSSDLGIKAETAGRWHDQLPSSDAWICQRQTKRGRERWGYADADTGRPVLGVFMHLLLYPLHLLGAVLVNPRLATRIWSLRRGANATRS